MSVSDSEPRATTDRASERVRALTGAVGLLGGLFWGPARQDCPELLSDELESVALAFGSGPEALRGPLRELRSLVPEDPEGLGSFCDELESEHVRLFVSGLGGVPAPPYQSAMESGRLMGEAARAMRERLDAAGLALGDAVVEPPDHLCVELEYLYHLLALSLEHPGEGALVAAARFAGEVMLPWTRTLAARIAAADPPPLYRSASDLLPAVLAEVAALA